MAREWIAAAALLLAGCASQYDAPQLPQAMRADYSLFAQRCSKCHSLARPLSSGIEDDRFWRRYVEEMRLKPGSGISIADEQPILRFLHYYSLKRRNRETKAETPAPSVSPPNPASSEEVK